jgi:hypothetical protein
MDVWDTATQNVVTEHRPHDDTVWEAYIQWYTLRTRTRVMYISPQPPMPVPYVREADRSYCHLPGATRSTLRLGSEFENATKFSYGTKYYYIY